MADAENLNSPANIFLQEDVYRLGSSPGLRSLHPGPTRDFLVSTWGPFIYRTSYAPERKRVLRAFLRCLNDAISRSLPKILTGSNDQIELLKKTYASKFFSARDIYSDLDEDGVRDAFHEYKVSLAIPAAHLPSRLRVCLMVDDSALSHLENVLAMSKHPGKVAGTENCWVKVVEENFPDLRFGDHPYVATGKEDSESDGVRENCGEYQGWTKVLLSALVEVFDGLRRMKRLVEYHREGRVYLGEGKWANI